MKHRGRPSFCLDGVTTSAAGSQTISDAPPDQSPELTSTHTTRSFLWSLLHPHRANSLAFLLQVSGARRHP